MEMTEMKGGTITLTLDPVDAFILARACDAAAAHNEESVPNRDHFAGLGYEEEMLSTIYRALASMFDAAGCCGFNQSETQVRHWDELALSALRTAVRQANHPTRDDAPAVGLPLDALRKVFAPESRPVPEGGAQ